MKNIFVVRHAKSSWRDTELADVDRPLKPRGVKDAIAIAQALVDFNINPDLILSSPAVRAIHTALIFARIIELPFQRIEIRNRLYASSVDLYFQLIAELNENIETLMIFGHDPTATYFVNHFLDDSIDKLPTSGVVGIQVKTKSWREIEKAKSSIIFQQFPTK